MLKNQSKEREAVILSGKVSMFKEGTYVSKRNKQKGSDEKSFYYSFTLTDHTGKIPAIYFSSKTNLQKIRTIKDGDSILVKAGTYETAEITKSVKILGANAGVNPVTEERISETIFTGDLIIAADNVTIDGIALTAKGRIVGDANGVKNPVIINVLSYESTVNPDSSASATAPIYFATTNADASFENVVISQVKYTGSTGRPMILYGHNFNGLTITDSEFISNGSKGNYNDGLKIESIKGNVTITGNHFEKYYQYVIWFMTYQEGTYKIANNTYKDCGQTASSHTGARFGTYKGADDGIVNITFTHNTVDNSFSLIRLDTNASRTAATQIVKVNYNKLLNCDNLEVKKDLMSELYLNPRTLHVHEISIIEFIKYIHILCKDDNSKDKHNNKSYSTEGLVKVVEKYIPHRDVFKCNDEYITFTDINRNVRIHQLECNNECSNKYEKLKVAISNIKINELDVDSGIKGVPLFNSVKQRRHYHLINLATKEKVDCLLLPEISLPIAMLNTYAEHSRRKQQLIIAGLEHVVVNDFCLNLSIVFLPYEYKGKKEVLLLPRIKNHYSPNEKRMILLHCKKLPQISPSIYHLINWHGMQFTVFNCYELADVFHRSLLRSHIDVLFAIEYNKDTYYYSNIVEATCRDLHCHFIQANTSDYGDSRLSIPKRNIEMTPVKIKGGDNDTIITFTIDVKSLRNFQQQDPLFQNTNHFKNTPPGFNINEVKNRS